MRIFLFRADGNTWKMTVTDLIRPSRARSTVGLLLSGGLDSSILLDQFLNHGWRVQPFYIRCGLCWETEEFRAVQRYLSAVAQPQLQPLVTLEMPLSDIYGRHWSITGRNVPDSDSPDQAVFLPGRNALLTMKAAFWCQLHQIHDLALGTLGSNPFPDATPRFFHELESVLRTSTLVGLRILRPFEHHDKQQVMSLGHDLPLELTFSCIAPVMGQHCGRCNKCVERQRAFQLVDRDDPTDYARPPQHEFVTCDSHEQPWW